ncbi:hydrophobic surface binding protein, partial [Cyathus striatus]
MVQLKSSFFAIIAFATVALARQLRRRVDISSISSQVSALDTAITAFPNTGGSLLNALAIHTDATNLATAINKGTTDGVSPKPFSEADGNTILAAVTAFEPTIIHALQQIVAKKAAFQGLPIGGIPALVKQDLGILSTNTSSFETALIAAAPTDLKSQATALQSSINAAFASAVAAY